MKSLLIETELFSKSVTIMNKIVRFVCNLSGIVACDTLLANTFFTQVVYACGWRAKRIVQTVVSDSAIVT